MFVIISTAVQTRLMLHNDNGHCQKSRSLFYFYLYILTYIYFNLYILT